MKTVLFLSRFTFVCNIAFLLFVFFAWLEAKKPVTSIGDKNLIALPYATELIVILGFSALIINLLMNFIYLVFLLSGKLKYLPKWLVTVNILFLLLQFYYFFYFNY